jgi:hypothetical protein
VRADGTDFSRGVYRPTTNPFVGPALAQRGGTYRMAESVSRSGSPEGVQAFLVLFRDPVAVRTLGESVAEGVLLGRRRRWARRGMLSRCRERQPDNHPHNQKHANCSHRHGPPFDGGRPLAGPHFRRYRAECGEFVFRQRRDCPTRRKEKSRSRPRPAHHKISIPLPAFGTAQPPRPIGHGHTGAVC